MKTREEIELKIEEVEEIEKNYRKGLKDTEYTKETLIAGIIQGLKWVLEE